MVLLQGLFDQSFSLIRRHSDDIYVCIFFYLAEKISKEENEAAMNIVKCPFGKFLAILWKYNFLKTKQKNHKIIHNRTAIIFDKYTLTLSGASHMRQIHIIMRRNHWLAVHRLHIDQIAKSSSYT